MTRNRVRAHPSTPKLVAAFASVYLIWGSTYLAIRFAIETLPPFLMAGVRFTIAGTILYLWARFRGDAAPKRKQWGAALIVGGLLLLGGNGGVVWAEQHVPSGLAALLVATEPLWIVLLDWLRPGGIRPTRMVALGLALGFIGTVILVAPAGLQSNAHVDFIGALVLIAASLCWAVGSLYSRGTRLPSSPILSSGMQMICGGLLLVLAGLGGGEAARFSISSVSLKSAFAMTYLLIFGSLVGFTSYSWLLRVTSAAKASTYAYVNPLVAVFLGWALANEEITSRVVLAAAVIVAAVAMITAQQSRRCSETITSSINQSDTPLASAVRLSVTAETNAPCEAPR